MRLLRNLLDFWLMAASRYIADPNSPTEHDQPWTDGT